MTSRPRSPRSPSRRRAPSEPRISRPAVRRHRRGGPQARPRPAGPPRQGAQYRQLDPARRGAGYRRNRGGCRAARIDGGDRGDGRAAPSGGQCRCHHPRSRRAGALPLHHPRFRRPLGIGRAARRQRCGRGGVGALRGHRALQIMVRGLSGNRHRAAVA